MNHLPWICCQIGAREHYAIPRALARQKLLLGLITDVWVQAKLPFRLFPPSYLASWRSRFHPELAEQRVHYFNYSLYQFELSQKIARSSVWQTTIARNQWFQAQALKVLQSYPKGDRFTLFTYSYAALELFKYAKSRGWQTVLGQIDAGIVHQQILDREASKHPELQTPVAPVPELYWANWLAECQLADRIIVNSDWSKQALEQQQISSSKIEIIPLAYQSQTAKQFTRIYPPKFTSDRPLKILYLGRVTLGKGIASLFAAMAVLPEQAIELTIVGSVQIELPPQVRADRRINFVGSVPRNLTPHYYQQADVFIFPTLSDGFGITQLEAQAWQLPIIASRHCGAVVKDRVNGLILPNVTESEIAKSITFCLNNPQKISIFSDNSCQTIFNFSLSKITQKLIKNRC